MANLVECPICNNFYEASKINGHVDMCLTKSKECQNDSDGNGNNRPVIESTEHRPSVSSEAGHKLSDMNKDATKDKSLSVLRRSPILSAENRGNVPQPTQNEPIKTTGKAGKEESLPNAKKSLSDVLGKRSFPKNSDYSVNESRKKLKISPSSSVEKVSKVAITKPQNRQCNNDNNKAGFKESSAGKSLSKHETFQEIDLAKGVPLAEQLRPKSFEEYYGQNEAVGESSSTRLLLQSGKIPSVILWGPPGCGKTSLVNIIAKTCKTNQQKRVVKLSATTSGINDVKEAVKVAKNELTLFKRETVLFIDEIHRFNKLQQDFFLPHVENGTITLIGATTENPSFHVNGALLSRCKVIVLKKHTTESICKILKRAVSRLGGSSDLNNVENSQFKIENKALEMLANLCDGDARRALNALEMAVNAIKDNKTIITTEHIKDVLQRNHVLYDKNGEEHYNMISALQKSIRGSDDNAALYWLARMMEGGENPLYVARRLVRIASEDIGLADSTALTKATAAYQACHFIGMPECDVILAHLVVYLARAPKSVEVYKAYNAAKKLVKDWKGSLPAVPLHLRNAPTRLMKELNYGKNYKYNPDFDQHVEQDYFPKELIGTNLFSD